MYKILVTTWSYDRKIVGSICIDFEKQEQALDALEIINSNDNKGSFYQKALLLNTYGYEGNSYG